MALLALLALSREKVPKCQKCQSKNLITKSDFGRFFCALINKLLFRSGKMNIFSIFRDYNLFYSQKMCIFAGFLLQRFFFYSHNSTTQAQEETVKSYSTILQKHSTGRILTQCGMEYYYIFFKIYISPCSCCYMMIKLDE